MFIQSLDYTSTIIRKHLKKYPHAGILTLYRLVRKRSDHSIIGCWPIIAEACFIVSHGYRKVSNRDLVKPCRHAEDEQLHSLRTDSQIIVNLLKEVQLD